MGPRTIAEWGARRLPRSVAHGRRSLRLLVLICLAIGAPAHAEDYIKSTPRPDPGAVSIPALQGAADSDGVRSYDKFYVYWRRDTSYETAFSDLDQCRIYGLQMKIVATTPMYAPLGASEIHKPEAPVAYQSGIVGGLIAGYFIDQAQKEGYIQTEKRCMAYKGYGRFGVSRANWTQIMNGAAADVLARRALIAAGLRPATQSVDP